MITSVGGKFVPPPLLKLIASPGATKPIRTPTAPALAAASIFKLTEHDPAIDESDLTARISQIRIRGTSRADRSRRATPSDIDDVGGNRRVDRSEIERRRIRISARNRCRRIDHQRNSLATTLVVAASASTSGVDAGCARIYGISPSLPAEITLTTPKFTMSVNASLSSSSLCPNDPPMDMLMMSTALFNVPVLVGIERKFDPFEYRHAAAAVLTELHTFTA